MRVKGIIFDMDGVLVRSSDIHRAAFEETLIGHGNGPFDYARYAGMRTRDVILDVLASRGVAATDTLVDELSANKSRLAQERLALSNPVPEGTIETLRALSANFTLALASSASPATVDAFLDRNGIRTLFDSVLNAGAVQHAKPHPEIYLSTLSALDLAAEECVVVEDAVSGVKAARAAGIRVIGVTGTEPRETLMEQGVAAAIDSVPELLTLVTPAEQPRPEDWTAVIPAAGKGTRLGYDKPKILFPVAGRTILEWLIEALGPSCHHFVFVLAPDGRDVVEAELARLVPGRFEIAEQRSPEGMGDAVACGMGSVHTPNVLVVWGDQVALRPESIARCVREFTRAGADVAVPTVWRSTPYIHFARNSAGGIQDVLQAREGDVMPERGESDAGVFLFRTEILERGLAELRASDTSQGRMTKEFNFLPIVGLLSRAERRVITPGAVSPEETVGINSAADAEQLAPVLAARTHHHSHA